MTTFVKEIWQKSMEATDDTVSSIKVEVEPVIPPVQVKVETMDSTTSSCLNPTTTDDILSSNRVAVASGKAQRAARRDMVNARRDKRKTMTNSSSSSPLSTFAGTSEDTYEITHSHDKSKKMKTGENTSAPAFTIPSSPTLSATMPSDAELLGEDRLRAMEAQLEHLDPESKEAKKKRRLIRNRMSAQLHRERKKAYVGQLEEKLMAKDREVKRLQEQLANMASEQVALKSQLQQVSTVSNSNLGLFESSTTSIKQEDMECDLSNDKAQEFEWESCLTGLEDIPLSMTDDFESIFSHMENKLPSLDQPDYNRQYMELWQQHNELLQSTQRPQELHAAKKNVAMMMAMMLSVGFCGSTPVFGNLSSGSNFSSMFHANPPSELSQVHVASRIMASLEDSSWEQFRDVSSWTTVEASEEDKKDEDTPTTVASPSAASDITDSSGASCSGSPAPAICSLNQENSNIGDDCDPLAPGFFDVAMEDACPLVENPVAEAVSSLPRTASSMSLNDANWLNLEGTNLELVDLESLSTPEMETTSIDEDSNPKSTSGMYNTLTKLWRENKQVLLTVEDHSNQVTRRTVAEIGKASGLLEATNGLKEHMVKFLYPLSAFTSDDEVSTNHHSLHRSSSSSHLPSKPSLPSDSQNDEVFFEVSCKVNAVAAALDKLKM